MCCEIHECQLRALLQELREVLAEEEEDRAGSVAAVLPDRSFVLTLALTCSLFAVQVTNHSAAFGHVTTILPSDWCRRRCSGWTSSGSTSTGRARAGRGTCSTCHKYD